SSISAKVESPEKLIFSRGSIWTAISSIGEPRRGANRSFGRAPLWEVMLFRRYEKPSRKILSASRAIGGKQVRSAHDENVLAWAPVKNAGREGFARNARKSTERGAGPRGALAAPGRAHAHRRQAGGLARAPGTEGRPEPGGSFQSAELWAAARAGAGASPRQGHLGLPRAGPPSQGAGAAWRNVQARRDR